MESTCVPSCLSHLPEFERGCGVEGGGSKGVGQGEKVIYATTVKRTAWTGTTLERIAVLR